MAFAIRITGSAELIKTLDMLKRGTRNRVVRPAARAAMSPVNKEAKRLAPKDTGLLGRSLGIQVVSQRSRPNVVVVVGPRSGFKRIVRGKPRDPVHYAHLMELGFWNVRVKRLIPPQAFLGPALRGRREQVMSILESTIGSGIERLAARGAR